MDAPDMPLTQLTLMLKINAWMRCKVPQIRLKALQSKIRFKVLLKLVRMCPCSLYNNKYQHNPGPVGPVVPAQPAPVQQDPIGPVVPAPQVFYQNWIGKKPEFSGKPEEDAESLSSQY